MLRKWANQNNHLFYDNVPINKLREYAASLGLDTGCDIDAMFPFIQNGNSLLDVGSGYGRVIKHLLEKGFNGTITAIERSINLGQHLLKHYGEQIHLVNKNIEQVAFEQTYDVVLFLWTNLSEWPVEQQPDIVKKLASWTKPGGKLIIDMIDPNQISKNANHYDNQNCFADTPFGSVCGYIASPEEMLAYTQYANLEIIKKIPYNTSITDHQRTAYLLQPRP